MSPIHPSTATALVADHRRMLEAAARRRPRRVRLFGGKRVAPWA